MPNPNEDRSDGLNISNVTEALLVGQGAELSGADQGDENPPTDPPAPPERAGELDGEDQPDIDQPDIDPPDEPAPDEDQPLPGSIKQLAERLGTKPAEIYKALKIDLDGTEVSLGEFKDRAKELHRVDELLADAESHRTVTQNETLRQQRALSVAMNRLGRNLTQIEVAEADQIYSDYIRGENTKTLGVISEWSDPALQSSELTAIGELMVEYGMSPSEIQAVADHRQIKILNDFARLRKRVASAKDSVDRKKGHKSGKARRKSADKPIERALAANKAGKLDTNSTILALIADGGKNR